MKKTLVVLVPGYRGAAESLAPLKDLLQRETELSSALWLDYIYREPIWSNKTPEALARELSAKIENFVESNSGVIDRIILAGHSMGTTLLRRAYLDARSTTSPEFVPKRWPELVDRIVLMGAFGRGFTLDRHPFFRKHFLRVAIFLARTFGRGKLRLAVFKGADFITRLRIDWVRFSRSGLAQPTVIHLLGSDDLAVRPEDVIDLEQFDKAIAIEVESTGHRNIATPGPNTTAPLKRAFVGRPTTNRRVAVGETHKQIFFLLHGIRDSRECFEGVGRELDQRCPGAKVVSPDYGFLSARSFLNKRHRDSYVRWTIDQLGEYFVRSPEAEFYFAGHSNGTYILGQVLKRLPSFTFRRVYLAASVLPRKFDWGDVVRRQQVSFVRSDMGTEDWPVGVVCNALNKLGMTSIGSGGYEGFDYGDRDHIAFNKFEGGHGSMLRRENTCSIADFLLTGMPAETSGGDFQPPSKTFVLFQKWGDILLPLGAVVIFLLILAVAVALPFPTGVLSAVFLGLLLWAVAGRA